MAKGLRELFPQPFSFNRLSMMVQALQIAASASLFHRYIVHHDKANYYTLYKAVDSNLSGGF